MPTFEEVEVGRRLSLPGKFANVTVSVRIALRPGETVTDALERASRIVDDRIPIEVRKAAEAADSLSALS